MVIPRLVSQAIKGIPLTIYGDGSQTRTFTYVQDVVEALMQLMECEAAVGELFNIGGTEEISILELADRIIQETGSNSTCELIPYETAFESDFEDMQRRVPSIEKIKNTIGFEPKTSLDAILRHVINYQSGGDGSR
jgi:UDP-glucose 4-epimerase